MPQQRKNRYQYVVICHSERKCGIQPLTEEQYEAQLNNPFSKWQCPNCGGVAEWDDDSLETDPQPWRPECAPRYKVGEKLVTGEFGEVQVIDHFVSPATGDECFAFSNGTDTYWAVTVQDQDGNDLGNES